MANTAKINAIKTLELFAIEESDRVGGFGEEDLMPVRIDGDDSYELHFYTQACDCYFRFYQDGSVDLILEDYDEDEDSLNGSYSFNTIMEFLDFMYKNNLFIYEFSKQNIESVFSILL